MFEGTVAKGVVKLTTDDNQYPRRWVPTIQEMTRSFPFREAAKMAG